MRKITTNSNSPKNMFIYETFRGVRVNIAARNFIEFLFLNHAMVFAKSFYIYSKVFKNISLHSAFYLKSVILISRKFFFEFSRNVINLQLLIN